jgi:hypothetical protein
MRSARIVCSIVTGAVLYIPSARAIPAFARREGVQCQMCHFRPPELNADGRAYLLRGFREEKGGMAKMEGMPAPSKAAAPMAKMDGMPSTPKAPATMPKMEGMAAAPKAPAPMNKMEGMPTASTAPATTSDIGRPMGMPSSLDWSHYLSIFGVHSFTAQRGEKSTFNAGEVDLFVAGPLNAQWSGAMNPVFDIQNGGSDVSQAYGQFITRTSERFGSARAGQILPLAILYNQGDIRMPLSPPVSMESSGDTGYGWTPTTLIRGVEVSAVSLPGWNVTLGAGQPKVEPPVGALGFERNTDVYASAERYVGKDGNSLTAYGYLGRAWLSPEATRSQFHRLGLFANVYFGPHRFDKYNSPTKAVLGVLTGKDKDVNGRGLGNTGYYALVERQLSDRLAAYARYDYVRFDLSAGGSARSDGPTVGVTLWAATEVRLTAEGQSLKSTGQSRDNRLAVEFLWVL